MRPNSIFMPARLTGSDDLRDHIPRLFTNSTRYDTDANEYLFERCIGHWSGGSTSKTRKPVTRSSARNHGYVLAHFLYWAQVRTIDIKTCDYHATVLQRYQGEMVQGTWSTKPTQRLSASTINLRVSMAVDYLQWLAMKKRRLPFEVPTEIITLKMGNAKSSHGHHGIRVNARVGRLAREPRVIELPNDEQLVAWLTDTGRRKGAAVALASRVALYSGVRKAELVSWRIDTLPRDPKSWRIANPNAAEEHQLVLIVLTFGTKGPDLGYDHGDKIGKERTIKIPMWLAQAIDRYRIVTRPSALSKLKQGHRGTELAELRADPHLFIDEKTGLKLTYDQITEAWRSSPLTPRGWSPHKARHWWACMTLLNALHGDIRVLQLTDDGGQSLERMCEHIIRHEIQPQLGHVSWETTQCYVQWVRNQMARALPELRAADLDALEN